MALIKNINDIPQNTQMTPKVTPIVDDSWLKIERIIGNISGLLGMVIQLRDGQGQGVSTDPILPQDSLGQSRPPTVIQEIKQVKPLIPPELQNLIELHVRDCLTENPEMTFKEMIEKIPLNATHVAQIILKLKGEIK